MRTFIHHDIPKLKQINSESGRTYETPDGKKYPSVTSVTGLDNAKHIYEWRQRVGAEEANKISRRASSRGTRLHKLCEDHLLGKDISVDMFDMEMWNAMKTHVNMVDNIHCLETRLYSHILKVAGTVDLIAEYNGELSILDWKTSRRIKGYEDVEGYFMQCAAYAQCFLELTGINITNLVLIMGVDDEKEALVFQQDKTEWLKKFKHQRYRYYKAKNI